MSDRIVNLDYEKRGFVVVREFIPHFFAEYLKEYFNTLKISRRLNEKGDDQVRDSDCVYGDPAFDTFMMMSAPMLSNLIGVDILPTYTYGRIYYNGAELSPHIDRNECEHSVTLCLGGESDLPWPIMIRGLDGNTHACHLLPGDIAIYKGSEVPHWREKFKGETQYQIFLHYVESKGKHGKLLYDGRPYIGFSVTS
jgi:hypothetical protein